MTSNYLLKLDTKELGIKICLEDDNYINIQLQDTINDDYEVFDNKIFFKEIWKNTDLEYFLSENEIKEFIYLKDYCSPRKFDFKIDGFKNILSKDGDILFLDDNSNLLYTIKKPFIIKDENIYDFTEVITHIFNPNTNIYSIILGNCKEEMFPLIIDPNFVFSNNKAISADVSGGIPDKKIIITGSDNNKNILDFSNKKINESMPSELLGSDIVTFNKNINLFFNMHNNIEEENININSITISGQSGFNKKVASNKSDIVTNIEIKMSAILIPILKKDYGSENPIYNIYYTIDNNDKEIISINNIVTLVKNPFDTVSVDSEKYGYVSEPYNSTNNPMFYNFNYYPPTSTLDMKEEDNLLIKIENIVEYDNNGNTIKTTKTSFIYVQFVDQIIKESFDFKYDCAKIDFMNADYYIPSSNRGLAIIDMSLGIVRTIDINSGMPAIGNNVNCANRIGTDYDPKGLLVATNGGLFYFCEKPIGNAFSDIKEERPNFNLDPYSEPNIYGTPIRVTSLKVIDFVMSGIFLFLLTDTGKILRFTYKTFLYNLVNKPLNTYDNIFTNEDYIDLSQDNDPYIMNNDSDINVFSENNFYDNKENKQYKVPYNPNPETLPKKLFPISVNSDDFFITSTQKAMESAYFKTDTKKLNGITVIYNQGDNS